MAFWIVGALVLVVAGLVMLAPKELVDTDVRFDPALFGGDVDAYFAASEAREAGVTPGTEKRVLWAGEKGERTPIAVVYLPGFSATSEEIRPVPDRLAAALGANLVFTRWSGHGQAGDAMAGPVARDWLLDTAEALAAAREVGDRVIVLATSTGATWVTLLATDADAMARVAGIAMVSPNFGIRNRASRLLSWPFARFWVPLVAGRALSFAPVNDDHARYWTTAYPTVATLPMAAGVRAAQRMDHGAITIPALMVLDEGDQVVSPRDSQRIAEDWGGPMRVAQVTAGPGDDPYHHVIAGDILSPGMTGPVSDLLIDWARGL